MICAPRILERGDALARCSETLDKLIRVYLSPEMREASALALGWLLRESPRSLLDKGGMVLALLGMSVHPVTIGLGLAFLLPGIYLTWSLFKGKKAPANPWLATGLEWTLPSPPAATRRPSKACCAVRASGSR